MENTWEFIKELFDPNSIIKLGLPLLLFVIFAETGLLIGFFLPGDSLVFLAGVTCATKNEYIGVSILPLLVLMSLSAILGNITGYWFGRIVGKNLYTRKDSFFFKRRRLDATEAFYKRHGGKALILGRFLPVIRTFAPILAGVIKIDVKKFMLYNIVGAVAWIGSFCSIGYFLGKQFSQIENYLGWIVISLIIITAIPVYLTYRKEKKRAADHND